MTPNYWCTWATQAMTAKQRAASGELAFDGDQGENALTGRNNLDENAVFGKNGWIHDFPEIREKMFFLFDDGWDIPRSRVLQTHEFGSQELSQERFPSIAGSPAERLKKTGGKGPGRRMGRDGNLDCGAVSGPVAGAVRFMAGGGSILADASGMEP